MRRVSCSGEIGDALPYRYTRTITCIRRHANQENKNQDPKPRRKTELFNVGVVILLVHFSLCVSTVQYVLQLYTVRCMDYLCVCARTGASIHGLPTCVRSHFSVISYCPEISGLRSCDGGGSGLSNKQHSKSIFLWFASCNIAQYTRTRT
jgi:hypothetical protein